MRSVSRISQRISTSIILLAALLFAPCALAKPYGSGWYGEVRAAIGHDSNLSRGLGGDYARTGTVASLALGGGFSRMIRENAELILSGYLRNDRYSAYSKLDNVSASLGARYIVQLTPGYAHPWFDTSLNLTHIELRGDQPRDGNLVEFRTSVDKRLAELVTGRIGFAWHGFNGRGDAFQTARREWFVGGDYAFSSKLTATLEYGYAAGSFSMSLPGHYTSAAYTGMSVDPVFGDCSSGTCTGWYAYASKGNLQKLDAGIVLSAGRLEYDFTMRTYNAHSDSGRHYRDTWVQLGAIFTFQ